MASLTTVRSFVRKTLEGETTGLTTLHKVQLLIRCLGLVSSRWLRCMCRDDKMRISSLTISDLKLLNIIR